MFAGKLQYDEKFVLKKYKKKIVTVIFRIFKMEIVFDIAKKYLFIKQPASALFKTEIKRSAKKNYITYSR